MALKHKDQIYYERSTDTLVLEPRSDESIRIKKIGFEGLSSNATFEVKISKTSVFYGIVPPSGRHNFGIPNAGDYEPNLFDLLASKGHPVVFPVANGESLIVKTSASVDTIFVKYDRYDAGDVRPSEPNGSASVDYTFIQYLTNANDISETGYYRLDKALTPEEFPTFPVDVVPSGVSVDVIQMGMDPLATSVGDGTASLGTSYTKFLHLKKYKTALFTEIDQGFLCEGNSSYSVTSTTQGYDYTEILSIIPVEEAVDRHMHFFDPPLSFKAGEELNPYAYCEVDPDVPIPAEKLFAMFILRFRGGGR